MNYKKAKSKIIALSAGFMLAAYPANAMDIDVSGRASEPYSCKAGGRNYNPQPASITINAVTGEILSGSNIDETRYPASLTKMMTEAIIFDALRDGRLELDDVITVAISPEIRATRSNSNSTWLNAGTKITVEEAIIAIGVASANNVSVLMAEQIAGSEAAFVDLMNEKAAEIGMTRTVFANASGLPNRSQVTTVRDMAKLSQYLMNEYPEYYHYFAEEKAEFGPWRGSRAKPNHNSLVTRNAEIDGIKTGFICDAGYNIAVSAEESGNRYITIVFGERTPYKRNRLAADLLEDASREMLVREQAPPTAPVPAPGDYVHDDESSNIADAVAPPFAYSLTLKMNV